MYDDKKYLIGRVLTIVEASITDAEQRKALKDIIQEAFWGTEGRGQIVSDVIFQFVSKYGKESSLFANSDEEERFNNVFGKYPSVPVVKEDYFPEK
jgi:hypothetical protein